MPFYNNFLNIVRSPHYFASGIFLFRHKIVAYRGRHACSPQDFAIFFVLEIGVLDGITLGAVVGYVFLARCLAVANVNVPDILFAAVIFGRSSLSESLQRREGQALLLEAPQVLPRLLLQLGKRRCVPLGRLRPVWACMGYSVGLRDDIVSWLFIRLFWFCRWTVSCRGRGSGEGSVQPTICCVLQRENFV